MRRRPLHKPPIQRRRITAQNDATIQWRSAVTNGKRLFVEKDRRGPWARRFRDLVAEITNDLGGVELLSEGQRQLIRRAVTISLSCERMEGQIAAGEEVNLETYGMLTDRLGHTFNRLGLKRQARDVSVPSVEQYLASKRRQRDDVIDVEAAE
jgi:hypothetical protein